MFLCTSCGVKNTVFLLEGLKLITLSFLIISLLIFSMNGVQMIGISDMVNAIN